MRNWRLTLLLMAFAAPLVVRAQNMNEEFIAAARKSDVAAVKAFLDKGVDVDAKTKYGATALSYACERGNVEIVKLLLDRGANVNVRDTFYKEVPMGWAIYRGHLEIIKLLLDKGAESKERVLLSGAEGGNIDMLKLALERGRFKPETLSEALTEATRGKYTEIVEELKKAGAVPGPTPDFQVDLETLKSYAGLYKKPEGSDITLVVKDGKLVRKMGDSDVYTLGAFDKTTFTVLEFSGVTIKFNLKGGKVVSLELKQGDDTSIFNRSESK